MIMTPVGAIFFTPSSIMGPRSSPCPAMRPNTTGTTISATSGAARRVMIRVMNVATMAKPSSASIRRVPAPHDPDWPLISPAGARLWRPY